MKPKTIYVCDAAELVRQIMVNIGSALSIILLCVHLILFVKAEKKRTLHNKNMASLCVALIFDYVITLLHNVLIRRKFCYTYVLASFYFNMASAFWMLTIAYTVWKKLRSVSLTKIAYKTRTVCTPFALCSLCNWMVPALINGVLFFVLPFFSDDVNIDSDFAYEKFNQTTCKFEQNDDMVKFVIGFYGAILATNVYFFASAVNYIVSTKLAVKRNRNDDGEDEFTEQFQLYVKLSLVMGLTWMTEMIMSVVRGFDVLNSTFRILNSLEGCFIAIAFTSSKEALIFIKSLYFIG